MRIRWIMMVAVAAVATMVIGEAKAQTGRETWPSLWQGPAPSVAVSDVQRSDVTGVTAAAVRDFTKRRLRMHGVPHRIEATTAVLNVNVNVMTLLDDELVVFSVEVEYVQFVKSAKTGVGTYATTWEHSGLGTSTPRASAEDIGRAITQGVDQFARDYLQAQKIR